MNMINGTNSSTIAAQLAANKTKVSFKVGMQTNLDAMITGKTGTVGTFYLTNDTHRLYVGTQDGNVCPVNEGVVTVATTDDLPGQRNNTAQTPHQGEFFYVTGDNILCVYSGTTWVQINPNTNTYIKEGSASTAAKSGATNTVNATFTVKDNNNVPYSGTVSFAGDNGIQVATDGTAGIKISGDTYTLSSEDGGKNADNTSKNEAHIKLASTNVAANASQVTVKGGDNVTITGDASNGITVAAVDTYNTGVNGYAGSSTTATANPGSNKGFKISVTDQKSTKSGYINPQIKYGQTSNATVDFVGGLATLDIYSKTDIDEKMKALNAMTYMGLVSKNGANDSRWNTTSVNGVPKDAAGNNIPVHVGDTYLFAEDTTITVGSDTVTITKGAMAIARSSDGTEQSDGTIAAAKLVWDYVESTNDTDTHYKLGSYSKDSAYGVQLVASDAASTVTGSLAIKAGDGLTVTPSSNATGANATHQVITVSHPKTSTGAAITATTETAATGTKVGSTEINYVSGVTTDEYGHITGFKTKKTTLYDTNSTIGTMKAEATSASNVATITNSLQLKDGNGNNLGTAASTSTTKIASTSLTVEATSDKTQINVDLMWGSF